MILARHHTPGHRARPEQALTAAAAHRQRPDRSSRAARGPRTAGAAGSSPAIRPRPVPDGRTSFSRHGRRTGPRCRSRLRPRLSAAAPGQGTGIRHADTSGERGRPPGNETGDRTLDCDIWNGLGGSRQRLMVLTARPGTPSHDALRILARPGRNADRKAGPGTTGRAEPVTCLDPTNWPGLTADSLRLTTGRQLLAADRGHRGPRPTRAPARGGKFISYQDQVGA